MFDGPRTGGRVVDCSGLENPNRKSPKTPESAEFCGLEPAQDAMFATCSTSRDGMNAGTQLGELERLQRERDYAVRWANQSVAMLQASFFPLADALRNLEAYLRNTPHHNVMEAAAARKALAVFDAVETPGTNEISRIQTFNGIPVDDLARSGQYHPGDEA